MTQEIPDYRQFDPRSELASIRSLTPEEEEFPRESRHAIRAGRLAEYKDKLNLQREGIARIVDGLHSAVYQNPDISEWELYDIIDQSSAESALTQEQQLDFYIAVGHYQYKHERVEWFVFEYPDPTKFFEACFDAAPIGKVEVIKGPMSICFRCWDESDYAVARDYRPVQENLHLTKPDNLDDEYPDPYFFSGQLESAGTALGKVKIPDLENLVTLENVRRNNPRYVPGESVGVKEVVPFDHPYYLIPSHLTSEILVTLDGADQLAVNLSKRDQNSLALSILDLDESVELFLTEYEISLHPNPDDELPIFPEFPTIKNIKTGELITNGHIPLIRNGDLVGTIIIHGLDEMTFQAASPDHELELDFRHSDKMIAVPNEESSQKVREHEDQHQFNKLFIPSEKAVGGDDDFVQRAFESSDEPALAVERLLHNIILEARRNIGIEQRARDEFIAYYRDGSEVDSIVLILTHNELYNYADIFRDKISTLASNLITNLHNEGMLRLGRDYADPRVVEMVIEIGKQTLFLNEVRDMVNRVMEEEYKAELVKWGDAVKLLERKGYPREIILNMLYQEPIQHWPNLARRMPAKTD